MTAPAQRPHRSVQVVVTPRDFVRAVEDRLGWRFAFDLAATVSNGIAGGCYFGPGSPWGEDALRQPWAERGTCWLNPPFGDIAAFAQKAAAEKDRGARIAMLTPASIGANWFAEHVHGKALVLAVRPRITFVCHDDPYPKDLILSVYAPDVAPGFDLWRWKP